MIIGQLLALVTAGCWAHNSVVYGIAGRRVGSGAVTHIRLWIALPLMALVHVVYFGPRLPLGITSSAVGWLLMSGFLGFFVADVLLFQAFVEIGHRETMVVLTLSPIFAAIISRLTLGEVLGPLQIVGIAITVCGVAWVVAFDRQDGRPLRAGARGAAIAVLGAVAQAAGMVMAKHGMGAAVHPFSANLLRLTAGLIGISALRFAIGKGPADFRAMRDRTALRLIAQGAVIGPVIGIIFNLFALTLAPVGIVTTIMQTSPVLLLPVDRFGFKRRLSVGAYIGTCMAVVGAVVLFIR